MKPYKQDLEKNFMEEVNFYLSFSPFSEFSFFLKKVQLIDFEIFKWQKGQHLFLVPFTVL